MRKLIVATWMSLDGISNSGSMEQWFNPYHSDSRAKSIQDTIADCEVMLYGRNTYQMLCSYWSPFKNNEMGVAEKLNKVKKYVVSTTLNKADWENTTIIRKDVIKEITQLKHQQGGSILVQGSTILVKALFSAGLIDEFKLLVQPHVMGTGKESFFNEMSGGLELINLQQLGNGVLQLCYRPKWKEQ